MNLFYKTAILCCFFSSNIARATIQELSDKDDKPITTGHNDLDQLSTANRVAGGYLFADPTEARLNLSDPLDLSLSLILNRDSPDLRPSRDCRDHKDIPLNVSLRAWKLLHVHASLAIKEHVDLAWPAIDELIVSSGASFECRKAVRFTLDGAKRMESWAVKLINSWGSFPPSGIYEGTYGDVGSFYTCLDIPNNEHIDHAHYCSITFKPVLPNRKDYELVVEKVPSELLKLFDKTQSPIDRSKTSVDNSNSSRDAFSDLIEHANYHHYVYYKTGTCWPIGCSPFDIKRIVKLIGRRNMLIHGPIKCYSKNRDDYEEPGIIDQSSGSSESSNVTAKKLVISIWDQNNGIYIWKPHFSNAQWVASIIILSITVFICFMTLIDIIVNRIPKLHAVFKDSLRGHSIIENNHRDIQIDSILSTPKSNDSPRNNDAAIDCDTTGNQTKSQVLIRKYGETVKETTQTKSFFMSVVDDCSIITNAPQFFRVSQGQLTNDILCLNGVRCITMVWIVMAHTMLYNDWSAFARTRYIEVALKSMISQPLFSGTHLVDSFFLMSGLLSAFTAFKHCKGLASKFNSFAYIFGRWLRLTPQIFFISMVYIVFPAISYGPHWFPIVGEYSENCVDNWWINVLHLQSFFKQDRMCNFVTWWISIDYFYHFYALAVIWVIILAGHKTGFWSIFGIIVSHVSYQAYIHYDQSYPPNFLSTIPQIGLMWTKMTLNFFWTPYVHSIPFFFGFYMGYLMALKSKLIARQLNKRRALIGWTLTVTLSIAQSYSTHWWVTGEATWSRAVSTIFFTIGPIIWASSLSWVIIACHYGYGGWINSMLSCKTFIVLGNILLSTLLGVFLCIVFEIPWLKTHRRLMKYV